MKFISDLISALKARQTGMAGAIVNGNATDYPAYQRLVGHHAGLEEALDILNQLLKEDNEDDDK